MLGCGFVIKFVLFGLFDLVLGVINSVVYCSFLYGIVFLVSDISVIYSCWVICLLCLLKVLIVWYVRISWFDVGGICFAFAWI